MQYIIFLVLAFLSALVILITLLYAWQRRNTYGAAALMVYLLVVLGMLFSLTMELLNPYPEGTLFWAKFAYLFIASLPVAWLAFAFVYAGLKTWLTVGRFWIFAVVPAITLVLVQSTEQHGLIWTAYQFASEGPFLAIRVAHGSWFFIFGVYMYALLIIGALLIGWTYHRSHRVFRQQSLWIVAGALVPLPVNALYVFKWAPGLQADFTPVAFAFAGTFFALGIFKYRLLNLAPIARAALVDTMPDGLIVLDGALRVADLNPAARQILQLTDVEDMMGRQLTEVWPETANWPEDPLAWPEVIRVEHVGYRRAYGLRTTALNIRRTGQRGWLTVLTDVSRRVDAEESLEQANRSLADANNALRRLNDDLEARIAARTAALSQRARELEALARFSSALRKADGLEELLKILLEETIFVQEASAGAVFLLERDELALSAVQGLPAQPGMRLAPCEDPLWQVMHTGEPLHLLRVAVNEGPVSDLLLSLIGRCNELSIAPLNASNRALGLILLVFDRPLTASLEERSRLLTAIAEMAGNALQRVQTMENLETVVQSRTRDLAALYEVTTASNYPMDLPELLEKVLATVVHVLGSRAAILHLVDESSASAVSLNPNAQVGDIWPDEERQAPPFEPPSPRAADESRLDPGALFEIFPLFIAAHAGLQPDNLQMLPSAHDISAPWVQVLIQRSAVAIPLLPVPIRVSDGFLSACVSVPVRAKGRVMGVLSILVESIGRFSAEDVALLAAISDHVGGAVERTRLRRRAEEAAVIEERQRLARDLHDSVTQSLYSLVLFAEAGNDALRAGNADKTGSHLARLRDTAQQALKEMRLLIFELRPLALQTEGLVGALRHRLEAVERRAGIDARLEVENLTPLPEAMEAGLYGIAQEALNNVLKHARATQMTVRLNVENGRVEMEIHDNGQGFDSDRERLESGIGISSMRERARVLGGEITIRSRPGEGTSILVKLAQEEHR